MGAQVSSFFSSLSNMYCSATPYNGEDVETALQNAEDLCNEELTMSEFVSVEPQYQYADEAK